LSVESRKLSSGFIRPRKPHHDKLKHIGRYNFKSGDAAPCEVHLTTALELLKHSFSICYWTFFICHLALCTLHSLRCEESNALRKMTNEKWKMTNDQ